MPQGQPYPYPQQPGPYQPGPLPPPRSGGSGKGCLIALAVGGGVVALIIVVVLVIVALISSAASQTLGTLGSSEEANPTVYVMGERPGYAPALAELRALAETYEETAESVAPPGTGRVAVISFVGVLGELALALEFAGDTESLDAQELDDRIAGMLTQAHDYESRFLAGQPLVGTVVGSTGQQASPVDGPDPASSLDALEAQAAAFPVAASADGTYFAAAEQIAAIFGLSLNYDFAEIGRWCAGSSDPRITAAFCAAKTDMIFVNQDHPNWASSVTSTDFVDTIRHELGHYLIMQRCGTPRPPIAGTTYEAVTNAYAQLFLAMDPASTRGSPQEYQVTEEALRIAEAIRGGRCS